MVAPPEVSCSPHRRFQSWTCDQVLLLLDEFLCAVGSGEGSIKLYIRCIPMHYIHGTENDSG